MGCMFWERRPCSPITFSPDFSLNQPALLSLLVVTFGFITTASGIHLFLTQSYVSYYLNMWILVFFIVCMWTFQTSSCFYPISKKDPHVLLLSFIRMFGVHLGILNCSGARWFVTFIDDCTRMTWVFLLKDKANVSTVLPHFYSMILTQFCTSIQKFRTDNTKDYFNQHLHKFFQDKGVFTSLPASTLHNKMEWLSGRWAHSSMSLQHFFIIIMFQNLLGRGYLDRNLSNQSGTI